MVSTLEINVTEEGEVSILHLNGPVDSNTQGDLEARAEEVINNGFSKLVFDLGGVTFLGSAGLRALNVIAIKFSGGNPSENYAHIRLANPSDEVRRILKNLGFDDFIGVHDNLQQAIESF